ncbi:MULTISPECIES: cutinase family protein [Rhodococcus]|uniref:Cutinase family protein n=1 Tax=Rhodococcus qingshengii JCM 15477 TaxID=1303681 RepID=A0AB38RMX2_RHOSG|nr:MULTISPECIES: cutinase family protein [Rhodococcus]UPU46246.1 cutinase family protein [Rhodococcus qingshengii JCM 15477]
MAGTSAANAQTPTSTPTPSSTTTTSSTTSASAADSGCTPLHLLLVNGTTDSSPDAPTDTDGGFFSQVAIPALVEANGDNGKKGVIDRSYVNYSASFGGKPGDQSKDTYEQSVQMGITNATAMLTDLASKCPDTHVFVGGYSQGAQVASALSREIGAGEGPISADRFAGAALFSDPTRPAGSPVFASSSQTAPAAAPGAKGDSVESVQVAATATPAGGGIAPETTGERSFGKVADRVASFCTAGDLACDTPADAPLARMVANIAGQSSMDTQDPVSILTSVGTALGQSVIYTGASVVNDNINFDSKAGAFTVKDSSTTVLNRMVAYSDPSKRQDGISEAVAAVTKIAGMGIAAAVTVAKDVLSPQSITQIAAAGVAGPQAAIGVLGAKVLNATVKLVPPATIDKTVSLAFNEVKSGFADNKGLAKMATDAAYWDTIAKHGSYTTTPVGTGGQTPVELATDWILALAHDLTGDQVGGNAPRSLDQSGPLLAALGQQSRSASEILGSRTTTTGTMTSPTTTTTGATTATTTATSSPAASSSVATSTTAATPTQAGIN